MHSSSAEWLPVASAPPDRELEVCILDYDGMVHALMFRATGTVPSGSSISAAGISTSSRRIGATGCRPPTKAPARILR